MADHPLRPATDRSLGGPLPRQLANRTRAHPGAGRSPLPRKAYPVLAAVSRGCPGPRGRFPRVTHPCAAGGRGHPRDLHVLSAPPAFVLSQDQTLSFSQGRRWALRPTTGGTLANFETARPTTPARLRAPRRGGTPTRHAATAGGSRPQGPIRANAEPRRPHVPSPILDNVKEQRRTRLLPRAPLGAPGPCSGSPELPSPDRRRRTLI